MKTCDASSNSREYYLLALLKLYRSREGFAIAQHLDLNDIPTLLRRSASVKS